MGEGAGHLVYRAVATNSHHHVHLPIDAGFGDLRSVAGIARQLHFVVVLLMIQPLLDEGRNLVLRMGARDGINDENDLLFTHNYHAKIRKTPKKTTYYAINLQNKHIY